MEWEGRQYRMIVFRTVIITALLTWIYWVLVKVACDSIGWNMPHITSIRYGALNPLWEYPLGTTIYRYLDTLILPLMIIFALEAARFKRGYNAHERALFWLAVVILGLMATFFLGAVLSAVIIAAYLKTGDKFHATGVVLLGIIALIMGARIELAWSYSILILVGGSVLRETILAPVKS